MIKSTMAVSLTIDGDDVRILSDLLAIARTALHATHSLITKGSQGEAERQAERENFLGRFWGAI